MLKTLNQIQHSFLLVLGQKQKDTWWYGKATQSLAWWVYIKNLSSLQQDKSSVSIIYHRHYALWSIDMKEEGGLLLFLDEMTMYVEISKVTW